MKRLFLFWAICTMLFSAACSSTKSTSVSGEIPTSSSDGSSEKTAIVINETSETKGVDAEYAWLRQHYPGYKFNSQSLLFAKNGKPYDMLDINTAEGKHLQVYFDISKFFGKF